jgi:metal-dependent amidase/aminoacylase/carboxypeptidase family protein
MHVPCLGYSVRLLGTPAEEGGGGKLLLINSGAYKDVDACFMVCLAGSQEGRDRTCRDQIVSTCMSHAWKRIVFCVDGLGYSVRLLGTPAEEGGGGKLLLINSGAYKDVDEYPLPRR